MTLRDIKVFLVVCETGSMSGAAKKLFMTQPAISQTISELEKEFNVSLFDRFNKKLMLTHAGEILLQYSKKILLLVEDAENILMDISNMRIGKLRIGASTTVGTYLLPEIIGSFTKKFDKVDTSFIIENTAVIEKHILDNDIDIGIVEGPIHSKEIIVKPYLEDELYLVCSKNHKWADKKIIDPREIASENMIIREAGSGTREVFESTMQKCNIKYNIKHILNSTEAIKKAVMANIGVSVISKTAIKDEIKDGKLVKINMDGIKFMRNFNIIYHKDKYHSQLFDAFINYLMATKDS